MLLKIISFLKRILLIDWIKTYREYRTLLMFVSASTETKIDNKALNIIDSILNSSDSNLSPEQKGEVANRLTKESKLIPNINIGYTEKEGFKASTTICI